MKVIDIFKRYKHYATETENPLVQVFYLFIGPIAYICYAYFVYYSKFQTIGPFHVILANIISFIAFYNYIKAWKTDPGTITKDNHVKHIEKHYHHFDNYTFIKNQNCSTCNFNK